MLSNSQRCSVSNQITQFLHASIMWNFVAALETLVFNFLILHATAKTLWFKSYTICNIFHLNPGPLFFLTLSLDIINRKKSLAIATQDQQPIKKGLNKSSYNLLYNPKNILEVPLGLSFHTFLTWTMKSRQNAILLFDGTHFCPSSQNIDKSVSTQRCWANLFSKKREKISLKFRMVNLCNDGTKDSVELWEIIHLKILTYFSIRQTKLF